MNHHFQSADQLGRFCAFVALVTPANSRNLETLNAAINKLAAEGIESSPAAMASVKSYGTWLDPADLNAVDASFINQLSVIKARIDHQATVEQQSGRAISDGVLHKAVVLINSAWNSDSNFEF